MKDGNGNIIQKKIPATAVTVMLRSSSVLLRQNHIVTMQNTGKGTEEPIIWCSFLVKELPNFHCGDEIGFNGKFYRIVDRTWTVEDDVTLILGVSPQL